MGSKNSDRLARLHQQGFIVFNGLQLANDRVETIPVARCLPSPTIDDEFVRLLSNIRIEIVHQTTQRGFLMPTLASQLCTAGRMNRFPVHKNFLWSVVA